MKYLKYRHEFLTENYLINEEIAENEITWGGSLLGRLINSCIRVGKAKYNKTKVEPLLKRLKAQLDYLIASSLEGDAIKKFNDLLIKKYMQDIKDVCLQPESSVPEDEKLDKLLGGHENLYDPKNPKANQITSGLVQQAINAITERKDLKQLMGMERDVFLDHLSDFNDELRKLTYDGEPGGGGSIMNRNFNVNFSNILKGIQQSSLIPESYIMLLEKGQIDVNNTMDFFVYKSKEGTKSFVTLISKEEGGWKVRNIFDKSKKPWLVNPTNLQQISKKTLEINNIKQNDVYVKTENGVPNNFVTIVSTEKNDQGEDLLEGYVLVKSAKSKSNYVVKANSLRTVSSVKQDSNQKQEGSKIDKLINASEKESPEELKKDPLFNEMLPKIKDVIKNPESEKIEVEYDGKKVSLKSAIQKFQASLAESHIFEMTSASSSTSTSTGGIPNQSGTTPIKNSVADVWKTFWEENDNTNPHRLTQREVEENDKLIRNGVDSLQYNPSDKPDPILEIVSVFKAAHDLYYHDVIPSGRPGGRVSQKTLRQYIKLGKGTAKLDRDSEPEGPFANREIFEKWRSGVLNILKSQEYRKILANMNFVVRGSEDKFNKEEKNESFNFILEEFEKGEKGLERNLGTNLSHGQILFQFMNDMLDKNQLDDFDELKSTLLVRYFGIKTDKKPKESPGGRPIISTGELEKNIFWKESTRIPKGRNNPKFWSIPIDGTRLKTKERKCIYIQILGEAIPTKGTRQAFPIRMIFDDQTKFIGKLCDDEFPKFTKSLNTSSDTSNSVYVGLLECTSPGSSAGVDIGNSKPIKIAYFKVNDDPNPPDSSTISTKEMWYLTFEGRESTIYTSGYLAQGNDKNSSPVTKYWNKSIVGENLDRYQRELTNPSNPLTDALINKFP